MKTVYRVENKNGAGMYTGEVNLNHCPEYQDYRNVDNLNRRHPLPSDKMMDKSSYDYWLFGFESIESLKKWLF